MSTQPIQSVPVLKRHLAAENKNRTKRHAAEDSHVVRDSFQRLIPQSMAPQHAPAPTQWIFSADPYTEAAFRQEEIRRAQILYSRAIQNPPEAIEDEGSDDEGMSELNSVMRSFGIGST